MIHYFAKHSTVETFHILKSHRREDVWVHADSVSSDDLTVLTEYHGLDLNVLRDVLDADELPRIEYDNDVLYVFLRTISRNKRGEAATAPLLAVLQARTYFTLVPHSALSAEKLMSLDTPVGMNRSSELLLNTFAVVTGEYEEFIRRTARFIKDTGHRLRNHDVSNKDFVRFVTIEDNLNEYQMNLGGMRSVAERLRENRHGFFQADDLEALDDIIQYMQQLLVAVASHSQSITSIRNAYSTVANNTLNQRMKTLTVLTLLVALPNVFYGMYGMNIDLPFQHQPGAYFIVVGFTAVLILCIYWLAKRFKIF